MTTPYLETIRSAEHPLRRQAMRDEIPYLRIYSPFPGRILNFSEWGMGLETVAKLESGDEHVFKIRRGSMLFAVKGKVQWSREVSFLGDSPRHRLHLSHSGISFSTPLVDEVVEFLSQSS